MRNDLIFELNDSRIHPRIWRWDYLALRSILKNIARFSNKAKRDKCKKILDLGCGTKPYAPLFKFAEKFTGFDIEKNDRVDVVGFNWNLPFEDDEFDALISTQVLEHTAKITETVCEIIRVVKNGGLIFISVPFVFPIHGAPYDYYRFTRYGLIEIFKDFEIIEIIPSGGFINTLLRLSNVLFFSIPVFKFLFVPVYLINNILALLFDAMAYWISHIFRNSRIANFIENVYFSLPENYCMILRNKK